MLLSGVVKIGRDKSVVIGCEDSVSSAEEVTGNVRREFILVRPDIDDDDVAERENIADEVFDDDELLDGV